MKYKVTFTATFITEIEVSEDESLSDVVGDIEIPENDIVEYMSNTFNVTQVIDSNGEEHIV